MVLGDFNIAPEDRDVHDPESWHERILCSTPEREALAAITDLGLSDSFRLFEDGDGHFSWWDYRQAAFRRNMGLRIDLILISDALRDRATGAAIERTPRTWERPSDHTPVIAGTGCRHEQHRLAKLADRERTGGARHLPAPQRQGRATCCWTACTAC